MKLSPHWLGAGIVALGLALGVLVVALLYQWETGQQVGTALEPTATLSPPLQPQASPTPTQPTATPSTATPTAITEPVVSFSKDVMPIFRKNCTACHGALGGLSLKSYEDAMTTGSHKPVILPDDPDGSLLYQRLLGKGGALMPPGRALPDEQIELIRQWVLAGAPNN